MSYDTKWKTHPVAEYTPKETKTDIDSYPIKAIPERGISKETCELLGIRSGLDEEDGKTVVAHYFPYYDQKGVCTGYKKRDLTKIKAEKGHFSAIGTVGVASKLFGQTYADTVPRKHKTLIIVEGEYDVASALEAMIESVKGTQYESLRPFIVGLSCGTANAVEAVLHNEKWVRDFDEIILGLDGDFATAKERLKGIKRGKEATEDIAASLMPAALFTVTYGGGHKDPSDYLQDGDGAALAKLLSFGKAKFAAEKITRASDISFESLIEKRAEGIYINAFPDLMRKIHGFRTRELVLVTAPSGVGKSTVTSIFGAGFIEAGERVGMIYLEEQNKETLQRMVAAKLRVSYLKFKNDPLSCAAVEDIRAAYDSIVDDDKLIMLGHFGSMPITEMMNKIKHMHLVEGCRYIILDHLSMVISGSAIDNERKELDIVMTELAAFSAANDVCIIVVSHINRSNAKEFVAPRGLEEGESYWVRVTKESLRGSASLEQLSFIIIGLEPEIKSDRSRGNVRFTVLKNRPWSMLGEADEFSVDENTWEVLLANPEPASGGFKPTSTF